MKITKTCSIDSLSLHDLPQNIQTALLEAQNATNRAHAPYSNFKVGSVAVLESGILVAGNNQENAAFPSGLCAERVAVLAAKANYPNDNIVAIAIAVQTERELKRQFTPSCGACLQVMSDVEIRQGNDVKVYIQGPDDLVYAAENVRQFLPFTFEL